MANKSGDAPQRDDEDGGYFGQVSKTKILSQMTEADRDFVSNIDAEYYKRVQTSDEFYRRKKLILMHLDRLEAKVARQAHDFDEY